MDLVIGCSWIKEITFSTMNLFPKMTPKSFLKMHHTLYPPPTQYHVIDYDLMAQWQQWGNANTKVAGSNPGDNSQILTKCFWRFKTKFIAQKSRWSICGWNERKWNVRNNSCLSFFNLTSTYFHSKWQWEVSEDAPYSFSSTSNTI